MTYRFGDFLRRHKYLIGAFLIPFFMMEIIAVIMEIQPFGNQSFMIVDALHQYLPFFCGLSGEASVYGSFILFFSRRPGV